MSKSTIFKVIEEQICIGVNKMDCDTYGEVSNEMKSMLVTVEERALTNEIRDVVGTFSFSFNGVAQCTIDYTGHVLHARTDRDVYVRSCC